MKNLLKSVSLCLLLGIWTTPVSSFELIEDGAFVVFEEEDKEGAKALFKMGVGSGVLSHLVDRCDNISNPFGEDDTFKASEGYALWMFNNAVGIANENNITLENLDVAILASGLLEGHSTAKKFACIEASAHLMYQEYLRNESAFSEWYDKAFDTDG